jgi:hypothetical protein
MGPKTAKKGKSKGKEANKADGATEESIVKSSSESDGGGEEQQGGEAANSASHQSEEEGHASEGGDSEHEPEQQERREGNATFATLLTQLPDAMRQQQQLQERQSLGGGAVASATHQVLNQPQKSGDKDQSAGVGGSGASTAAGGRRGNFLST